MPIACPSVDDRYRRLLCHLLKFIENRVAENDNVTIASDGMNSVMKGFSAEHVIVKFGGR
jgi:hypothetical protein